MKRLHLFEWEDQSWFPSFIRDYGTDFLQFVANAFDMYRGVVPEIKKGIQKGDGKQVIDIASGGGGPWLKLVEHLKPDLPDLKVKLTDYYPNERAFNVIVQKDTAVFSFEKEPVSALDVPPHLKGFRTQFLSFHHFKPEEARQILQNAVDNEMPIGIFEGQERNISHLIRFFLSPISVLLTAPFIRPFKIGRIIFTYLIPIVPLFVWWDGLVSVLRTYSIEEMGAMIQSLNNSESYDWEVGKQRERGVTVLYLLGYPKET